MKKLTLLLACIMVFASIASVCVSASDVTYTAAYADAKPVIDGKVDDAWAQATATTIAGTLNKNTGNATAPTLKMMHDETYIYALVTYTDTNGTIDGNGYVDAINGNNKELVGNDFVWFAFADADDVQKSFVFNAPAAADGSISMNLYHSEFRKWHCNVGKNGGGCGYTQVENDEEGARAVSLRTGTTIVWELRLLKTMVGNVADSVAMEIYFNDAAVVNGEDIWTIEAFDWAQEVVGNHSHIDNIETYGTLKLAAAPTDAGNTEDTTADNTETTTAKQEESTTAKQETTTANEPANTGSTTAPSTADAGLAIAAVIMACAAMIVLKKKH